MWRPRRDGVRPWWILGLALAACGSPGGSADGSGAWRGLELDPPVAMPELTLTDLEGRPFYLRDETRGRVTLLFFGFTHCPDVCPVHMSTLGAAYADLLPEERGRIRVLFVSTDPDRDTPERLRSWLGGFHPSFEGLRAPMPDIDAALAALRLPGVAVIPSEHGGHPLIGHPAAILAFGPDGVARLRYPFGTRQADWAHDLPLLAAAGFEGSGTGG